MKYIIEGKVIKGDGYGKKIGFPTINIESENFLKLDEKPSFGIYAGVVYLDDVKYRAGIVIGPLDENQKPKIEAHLIGYKGDAYGKNAIFEIKKYIREFHSYDKEEELIAQIKKDLEMC